MPTFETLLYDVTDGVATITMNRPEKLNAFNTQMMVDMIAAFDATDADDAVRAVIVTGAGRAFCAGRTCRRGRRPSTMMPGKPYIARRGCVRACSGTAADC